MTACKLMAHMIAGYPDMNVSFEIARALVRGGADYLEVQFPFSDPSADGPLIERAGQAALDKGFRLEDGFKLMTRLGELGVPLFIMTYGSLVFARGADDFARRAADSGVTGLIIPDLPPDYDEGLFAAARAAGITAVPVIAPGISDERLRLLADLRPEWIYTALRLGITGSRTTLGARTIAYLDTIAALGARIIAGFGVRSREQMHALDAHAHAAAVGSFFLERMNEAGVGADLPKIAEAAARELKG